MKTILTSEIEHASVYNLLDTLNTPIHYLKVGREGHIDLKEFLHDESFTGDAGSFYLAAADIDLSGFIYDQNDIIAVREG